MAGDIYVNGTKLTGDEAFLNNVSQNAIYLNNVLLWAPWTAYQYSLTTPAYYARHNGTGYCYLIWNDTFVAGWYTTGGPCAGNPGTYITFPYYHRADGYTYEVGTEQVANHWNVRRSGIANLPPSANAGPDQKDVTGRPLITLAGSGSDPEGATITYAWTITSRPPGSTCSLSSSTAQNPTFTPDVDGNYIIRLITNDGTHDSDADTVLIECGWTAYQYSAGAPKYCVCIDGYYGGCSVHWNGSVVYSDYGSTNGCTYQSDPVQVHGGYTYEKGVHQGGGLWSVRRRAGSWNE